MKPTPMQVVKEKFGGRETLVEELVKTADKLFEGDDDAKVRSRLMGLANKKLLRLYGVEQKVRERYGDREALIKAIVEARAKAGLTADEAFIASLSSSSKARLLDMTRARHGERPAKQTPEERMKKKRGRKQLERAKAKA